MAIGKKTWSTEKLNIVLRILASMFFIGPVIRTLVRIEIASVILLYIWAFATIVIIFAYLIFSDRIKDKGNYVAVFIAFTLYLLIPPGHRELTSPVLGGILKCGGLWCIALILITEKDRFLGIIKKERRGEDINPWK